MFSFLLVIAACVIGYNASAVEPTHGSLNKYFIYTRTVSGVEIDTANITSASDVLSDARNTTVIVHGHRGSATTSLNPDVKEAFLTHEDIDVIVVDWSAFARMSYKNAVGAVPSVGLYIANLINELVDEGVVDLKALHLVGFDLGAHIIGFAGRALNGEVARLTGLNPSRNQWGSNSRRLNRNDAEYVEVIHTDGDGLISYGIGEALGHVDFFPNGGNRQPGCALNNWCSHNRSWQLMAASLTHNHFEGNRCDNWLQVSLNKCRGILLTMGNNEYVKRGSGMFRVNTRSRYPF